MERVEGWVIHHRLGIGITLFALGLLASVWLAFGASSDTPPNGAQSAILVVIGGLLNLSGAWCVSRRPGAANLTAARMTVRHLADITRGVGTLRELAEDAFERRSPGKAREDIGQLSWKLSDVESRLIANVNDWTHAYPDLVEEDPRHQVAAEPEEQ